ncbi:MAG: S1C family serine protease [Acetanaerobacterium sp.]
MSDYDNKDSQNENKGFQQGGYQSGWSYQQSTGQWKPPASPPYASYQQQKPPYTQGPPAGPQAEYKWNLNEYDQMSGKPPQHRPKNHGLKVFLSIIAVVLSLSVLGFAGFGIFSLVSGGLQPGSFLNDHVSSQQQDTASGEDASAPPTDPNISIADVPQGADDLLSVSGVLTTKQIHIKVAPSVVGVVTYQMTTGWVPAGEGSGIIIQEDGYILTNAHVVSSAQGVKVVLSSEKEYEATVVGVDTRTDLAVLKIDATGLTAAEFGNSDQMATGDKVVAFGNPGGLEFAGSITQGIISAVNRQITSSGGYTMECIQTDAAINPGNSGGALVNEFGQVIGINSAKIAATEYEGIGFAIPSNTAIPIISELITNGRVTGRAKIGITISGSVGEMEAQLYSVPTGVVIAGVERGSDIAAKGVLAYDIITKMDGVKIDTINDIYAVLEKHQPGDNVTLTIFRRPENGADQTFDVTIALYEDTGESVQTELPPLK